MDTRSKITTLSAFGLAVGLSLGIPSSQANADGTVACSSVSAASARSGAELAQGQITVLDSQNLYRFQARPWARIPEGVALRVRVPAGMTAADLHNKLSECQQTAKDESSPLCVAGASLKVTRSGGSYVVSITSDTRSTALEIQRRATHK